MNIVKVALQRATPFTARFAHTAAVQKPVPAPRGDITDAAAFLNKIGRNCGSASEKFKSWDHLFNASPLEMRTDMALSVKQRRWILSWREKYRQGIEPYHIPAKPPKKKSK